MKKNKNIKHDYFKTWSHKMSYILGFIMADGWIYLDQRNGRRYGRLGITIHKNDRDLLVEIAKELGLDEDRVHDSKRENTSTLYVYSTTIYDDLISLGVTQNKSLTLQWPTIPKEFLKDFIRGYFDGDGSITEIKESKNSVKIVIQFLGTESFLRGIIQTFDEFLGIKDTGKKIEKTQTNIKAIRYRTKQARTILEWLYDDAEIFLKRKFNRFEEHKKKKVQRLHSSSEVAGD